MSLIDSQNLFSDDQTLILTVAGGEVASTNIIDLGVDRDIGKGEPVPVLIQITTAVESGGAGTLQVKLQTDDNASFSSPTDLYDSGALAKTVLVEGYKIPLNFVPRENERYLRVTYTPGTADLTAGAVLACIGSEDQTNLANV